MSNSSRVQLRGVKEAVLGTTPASALTNIRNTGDSLQTQISTTQSGEIRADRNIPDLLQTQRQHSGGFNFEMSNATYDDFIAAAMLSAWGTPISCSAKTDISAASADNSFNATVTSFITAGIVVGQWIKVAGFTNAANNGFFRVVSVTAAKIVVTGGTLVTAAASNAITITGTMVRNGTTVTGFSLEKQYTDLTNEYFYWKGMVPGNLNLTVGVNAIVTGDLQFMGLTHGVASASIGTGGPTAANTNPIIDTVSGIGRFEENSAVLAAGTFLNQMTVALNNNLRAVPAVGLTGPGDIGYGRCSVTGNLNVYFTSRALYEKWLNKTYSSASMRMADANGNAYIVTIPKLVYTNAQIASGGNDSDVMCNMQYQALLDTTTNCSIQIDKF